MNTQRIDSIDLIDLVSVTFSDLRWHCGTGVAVHVSGTGRDKKYRYRHGVMTDIGDIEESVWYEAATYLVRRESEADLFEMLVTWETEHNYTNASPANLRLEALQCYVSRLFNCPEWVDFIPFNRRFRPHALVGAHLVKLIYDCCGHTKEATQEQINRSYNHTVYCQSCGDWTTFSTVPLKEADPPWQLYW